MILMIGWFMCFVDDDEAEILDRGKEGRTRADDDARMVAFECGLPEMMADGLGLLGVEQNNIFEMLFEVGDELRGEGDFGNE